MSRPGWLAVSLLYRQIDVRRAITIRRADWAGCGVSVVEGEAAGEGKGGHDAVISGETGAMARDDGLPGYLLDVR